MTGSNLYVATDTGDHFACSLAMPLYAMAVSFKAWPGPIFMIAMPSSCARCASSSLAKWAGDTW